MPVRSLNSSVLKWPDRVAVDTSVRRWARAEAARRPDVVAVGYYGSYARGDWGVGSDVDLIAVVEASAQPFETRATAWDATSLPVPADLSVYTSEEWRGMAARDDRFARTLAREAVWVFGAPLR